MVADRKTTALLTDGIKLPKSAVAQDAWGRDVPRIALDNGDLDGWCQAVPDSLVPVLTATGVDRAQIVLTMFKDDGAPLSQTPDRCWRRWSTSLSKKVSCWVAIELEFNLFKRPDDNQTLREALPAENETGGNLYGLRSLDEHAALFEALKASFEAQGLPYEGVLKEAAPAQYEINVAYSDDAVAYCDQVIRMQRCIRAVAERFGALASFMPKPMENQAGNGMHVH